MSAGDATLQLFLANKRQREAGLVMESSQELSTHIQISGKAQLAIHNQYKARGYNFFLCCAHPPSIYQAAKDDGWFVRLRNDEREWKKRFHDRTVPHHTLAVKIYSRTVSSLMPFPDRLFFTSHCASLSSASASAET